MSTRDVLTAAEIEGLIAQAMREGDMPMIGALLGRLAFVAPDHAQLIIDHLQIRLEGLA